MSETPKTGFVPSRPILPDKEKGLTHSPVSRVTISILFHLGTKSLIYTVIRSIQVKHNSCKPC